jgi:hypothetical protein
MGLVTNIIGSPLGGPHSIRGVGKLVGDVTTCELGRAKPHILGPADRAGPAPGAGKKHLTRAHVATPGGGSNSLVILCMYLLVCVLRIVCVLWRGRSVFRPLTKTNGSDWIFRPLTKKAGLIVLYIVYCQSDKPLSWTLLQRKSGQKAGRSSDRDIAAQGRVGGGAGSPCRSKFA